MARNCEKFLNPCLFNPITAALSSLFWGKVGKKRLEPKFFLIFTQPPEERKAESLSFKQLNTEPFANLPSVLLWSDATEEFSPFASLRVTKMTLAGSSLEGKIMVVKKIRGIRMSGRESEAPPVFRLNPAA